MNYNWNWKIFWELSPDGQGTYAMTLVGGLGWTLATALSAWVIALVMGALIGTSVFENPTSWQHRQHRPAALA